MNTGDYSATYDPDLDFDRNYTIATGRRIAERVRAGDRVLELGCATGLMTVTIAPAVGRGSILGIDRSEAFLSRARHRELESARFVLGDLDNLSTGSGTYDHVVATNVLHELADPVRFLELCATHLAPGGVVHLTLQNPQSIHRLCALEAGLISSLDEVSARGEQWGTRGLWSSEQLQELARKASLITQVSSGIMLKPLPNSLMSELPAEVLETFVLGAKHLPNHCAMTYLVLARG